MCIKLFLPFLVLFSFSLQAQVLNWNTDISNAITVSKEQRKPMLILFTDNNADKALESQILKTLDFALWSRDNVVLVKLDLNDDASNENFERNQSLKKAFGVQDLPEICFSNVIVRKTKISYRLLGKTSYKSGTVKAWIEDSNRILNARVEEE